VASRLLYLLFAVGGLCTSGPVQAREPVHWSYLSFPPQIVVHEDGELSGSSVVLQRILEQELAEYRHESVRAPLSRALLAAGRGEPYCMAGIFRLPERERVLIYSTPCRIVGPFVAVTLRGGLDPWKSSDGRVSLRELLADQELITGRVADMSYGSEVDALFEESAGRPNVIALHDMSTLERPLLLLLSGRVRYMILSPEQSWYAVRSLHLEETVELVPLLEARTWQTAHVACTRSSWGREVMPRVERVLHRLRRNGQLKALCERDVPPGLLADFHVAWGRIMRPGQMIMEPPGKPETVSQDKGVPEPGAW